MDASLTCLSVMTSVSMHKMVYLEDVIERMILYAKFQLHNTIYPEFDPVYRISPGDKGRCREEKETSTFVRFDVIVEQYELKMMLSFKVKWLCGRIELILSCLMCLRRIETA
jgi:cohesin loading factor subunit SCC2